GHIARGLADFRLAAAIFGQQDAAEPAPPHKARHDAEQQAWLAAAGIAAPVTGPLHVEAGARLPGAAVNPANCAQAEGAWRQTDPQLVVIDDFLTPEALTALRRFCRQSTM